ncbi:ribosomal protein L14, putative [Babesia bigemina]|uniref:Ribosomal protein L14, putative n=1 Tax=Babesia bigemina TaxID=5866 RepID=A0A061D6G2_BABBI|nr:ribosomal protein L14, putative [Babesia bigemina]CDR94524.1 ribosomal protein L14, putative [Babesia bigemina]|eukprot:XP_012766710.1 ribosomal protein L14, putative [Babesia bigemina]
MPLFTKFVEPGRLCLITYGPDAGKLCFIVDVVTNTRVLVDGAKVTGVERQQMPITWIKLTDTKITLCRGAKTGALAKAIESQDAINAFKQTPLGKRLEFAERRKNLNDFERFKLMIAHKERRRLIKKSTAARA